MKIQTSMISNNIRMVHILMVLEAQMLGLASVSGSWELGPHVSLHKRGREPGIVIFQAHSLVGKVELVQVRFTLRLRNQRSK